MFFYNAHTPTSKDDDGATALFINDAFARYPSINLVAASDPDAPLGRNLIIATSPRHYVELPREQVIELQKKQDFWNSPVQLPEEEGDKEVKFSLGNLGIPLGDFHTVIWTLDKC
ncbi:hypothetical protein BD626DRAFT_628474 [Schizophyllum amplum]|uniref:Uncharacterized protein n=1 Tax=Schizophyllum amplum TaxID=97359 RepID=A0A550CKG8_9AGAR|nr:hypothetical protein BD626DRAFT_628474 [Auriculariopsis ampla]